MTSNIEIKVDAGGRGKIIIDGVDFSNKINKVEFVAQAGELTEVVLTMQAAEVKVIGSAWVSTKLLTIDSKT